MKNKLIAVCALSCAALGLNACAEGPYSNLDCDSSYVAECLNAKSLMFCDNGKLTVTTCDSKSYCRSMNGGAAECAPISSGGEIQSQCSHVGTQCSGNSLVTCTNGQITANMICPNGCDASTNTCKTSTGPSTECTPGEKKCAGEAGFAECDNSGNWMYADCRCEDDPVDGPRCISSEPETCTPGAKKCAGNAGLAVCSDSGSWEYTNCTCENDPTEGPRCAAQAPDPCASCTDNQVCKQGACVEKPAEIIVTDVVECEADDACDVGFVCANKACVPKEMSEANEGDPCDEAWYDSDYYEFCDADGNARYCSYDDNDDVVLFVEKCSAGCRTAYSEDTEGYTAICENAVSDACFTENEEIGYCEVLTDSLGDFAYSSYYVCMPTTDGTLAAVDMAVWGEYTVCNEAACTAEGTCEGGDVPTSCDYESKCDGDVLSVCYDLSMFGLGVFEDVVDCKADGMVCDTLNEVSDCYRVCSEVGAVAYSCEFDEDEGIPSLVTSTCTDMGNGKLYDANVVETCGNACDAEAGKCKVLEVGDACDETLFVPECIGSSVTKCEGGVVALDQDCAATEGNVCAVFEGIGYCMKSCANKDDKRVSCEPYEGVDALLDFVCVDSDNGLLVWDIDGDGSHNYFCSSHKCASDTACELLVDDEGAECDYYTQSDACRDNILVTCSQSGILVAENCAFEDAICGVLPDGYDPGVDYATCFTAADACQNEGEESTLCSDSVILNRRCYNTSIGLYNVVESYDYCTNGCADDKSCK